MGRCEILCVFFYLYNPKELIYLVFRGIPGMAGPDTLDGSDLIHIHQAETLSGSLFDRLTAISSEERPVVMR